ncbi:MAG: serine protease, partial [Gordonia sp. (in: high G+C Gram-positive bacteria)]
MTHTPDWSAGDSADTARPATPPQRPTAPVSPQTAAVFGRPAGVNGSFAVTSSDRPQPETAAPDPVLSEAFGRPAGSTQTLQRDPYATFGAADHEVEPADPWRDPAAAARLDGPA